MLVFLIGALVCSVKSSPCELVKKNCAFHAQCSVAMGNYFVHCGDFMAGRSLHCSDACKKSAGDLSGSDIGRTLSTCDCGEDSFCSFGRDRMLRCDEDRGQETDCREAAWVCAADGNCSTALALYRRHCMSLVHHQACTNDCRKSFYLLKTMEKAVDIFSCECTGIEDYPCHQTVLELCGRFWNMGTQEAVQSSGERSLEFGRIVLLFLALVTTRLFTSEV